VVRLRRDILATVYGVLLIVLLIANWVGIRERYAVGSFPCSDVNGVAVGDVDVHSPGDELVFWTASDIYVIYNATSGATVETVYAHSATRSNPLAGVAIADFNPERKGKEIMALMANGTVLLLWRDTVSWKSVHVADLPWPSPVWTTRAMVGARFDASSLAAELVIAGEYFDWPTLNRTGRVLVVNRVNNVTWQVSVAYTAAQPLLCAAAGDLNRLHPGLELLTAGEGASVKALAVTNGSWSATSVFTWSGVIPSVAIGNLIATSIGYEVGLVLNGQCFLVTYNGSIWQPLQIWRSDAMQVMLQTLIACDVDPFNPGDELLGVGASTVTGDTVLVILAHSGLLWTSRVLLTFPKDYVTTTQPATFDFSRAGVEIVVASRNLLSVYAIPSSQDRTVRAAAAVLLPAVVLLPGTVILFVLADYVGGVAAERRRKYGLLMAAKGFVQCPICKRFLPRANLEGHRRLHRQQQLLLAR
jgi:hypothetical protein